MELVDEPVHGAGAVARAQRPGRHEHPEQQVDDDAGAAGDGEADEADPPEHDVDAAVLGEAAADAAEHLLGAAAAELRTDGRLVERSRGWRTVRMSCPEACSAPGPATIGEHPDPSLVPGLGVRG